MFKLAELFVPISASLDGLDRGLGQAKSKLQAASHSMGAQVAASGTSGILAGLGPLLAIGAAGVSSFKFAQMASTQTEAINLLGVTFRSQATTVEKSIDSLVDKFGESKTEMLDLTSSIGGLFQGLGVGERQTAKLSTELTKLAIDFGSLKNLATGDMLTKIMSGLSGESEPLRRVGIVLNENIVAAQAMAMGLANSKTEISEQAKIIARAHLIMRGLSVATGDADKTHHEFAGQLREVGNQISNLGTKIGTYLEPAWTSLLQLTNKTLRAAIKGVDDLAFAWNNLGLYVRKAEIYFDATASVMGSRISYIGSVISAFSDWFSNNWVTLFVDAAKATSVGLTNVMTNISKFLIWFGRNWRTAFADAFNATITALGNLAANFMAFGKSAYDWIASGFQKPFEFKMTPILDGFQAKSDPLPEMKALFADFKAMTEAFQLPEENADELAKIWGKFEDDLKQVDDALKRAAAKQGADVAAGNGPLDAANATGLGSKDTKAEFVGLEDFAKRIQAGALGKDNIQKGILNVGQEQLKVLQEIKKQGGKEKLAVAK